MPELGDLITAFSPQPGRCFRMVYSRQLQASHCRQPPLWKGIWRDRTGKSWYVQACRKHAPKVTSKASEEYGGVPQCGTSGLGRRHRSTGHDWQQRRRI